MSSTPRTHFGYGIYFMDDIVDVDYDSDEDPREQFVNKLAKAFGVDPGWNLPEGCPVVLVRQETGDYENGLFLRSTYHWTDWDSNGEAISQLKFIIPDLKNAKAKLAKGMEALGTSSDLIEGLLEKACFFTINYMG